MTPHSAISASNYLRAVQAVDGNTLGEYDKPNVDRIRGRSGLPSAHDFDIDVLADPRVRLSAASGT